MSALMPPESASPGIISWAFLVTLLLLLPLAVIVQQRQVSAADLARMGRREVYMSALLTHAFLLLAGLLAVRDLGVVLFPPHQFRASDLLIGAGALAIGLLPLAEPLSRMNAPGRERAGLIAPRTRKEYAAFGFVAVSAGFAEEIAYRGALFALLWHLFGNWWLAAGICAGAFGVVHFFQGWRSAAYSAVIGFVLQVATALTGTLAVAIAVHVAHDLIAGVVVGRRMHRLTSGGATVAIP